MGGRDREPPSTYNKNIRLAVCVPVICKVIGVTMKKILFLSVLIIIVIAGISNASVFFQGSIDEALSAAKEKGKYVLINFYSLT